MGIKTPKKVWLGHPPDLDKLRVFGCVAYAHIRQDKIEPRALRCMFLGYAEGVKAYWLWYVEPSHKRCIRSQDVVLNETEMYFKKIDDVGRSTKISEEELEHEETLVEVEHIDVELHNLNKVEEEAQHADETKENVDDYLAGKR